MGIVSFAFIGMLGLIPTGLSAFHEAVNTSVGAQIAQRVINDVQQTDFAVLTQSTSGVPNDTYRFVWTLPNGSTSPVRYFDDQGNEVSNPAQAVYQVNTRVMPMTITPGASTANSSLATVTVQVTGSPGSQQLVLSTAASSDAASPLRNLWTGATQSGSGIMPISTYFTMVSRNE